MLSSPADEKASILLDICNAYLNSENDKALEYAELAIDAAEKSRDTFVLIESHIVHGELLSVFDKQSEALLELEEVRKWAKNRGDSVLLSDIHGALGGVYTSMFNYEQSLIHYEKGVELARQKQNVRLQAKHMNNLAAAFEMQGELKLALKTFVECTQILKGTKYENDKMFFVTLLNSAMTCNSLNKPDSAIGYLKTAINGFYDLSIHELYIHSLVGLVQSFTQTNRLDSALFYYQKLEAYPIESGLPYRRYFKQQVYNDLLFKLKRYPEAIESARGILEQIGDDIDYNLYAEKAAELLYKCYKAQGDLSNSLKHLEIWNKYSKLLHEQQAKSEIKALRVRFETELDYDKKLSEIAQLELRDTIHLREIEKQKNWRNFIIILSVLGFLLSVLVINQFRLKTKAAALGRKQLELEKANLSLQVEHKNRELTSASMHVAQKNQMLMQLQEHLSNLANEKKEITSKDIRSLRNEVKQNIQLEDDWEKIKLHFEEVYPDYFKNLKTKFPDLTTLELKHCAYIKMNLSTKDVARMLSVAPKSVQMSHYRLKKKLGLGTEQSLSNYLSKF